SILDAVPADQDKKLVVLAQIRTMLDSPDLDALDDKQRAELEELKPPGDLAKITFDQLPPSIKDKPEVTEADGRVGLMISIHSANGLDEWNGHDLIRFSNAVRTLHLRDGETVTTSGSSVIFADIIDAIESDGPRVTLVAAIGLVVMVLLTVGRNRRAVAVLIATVAGSLLMVAVCALLQLKVNFLDFVALPITLGLGIDYAINVAHRQDSDAINDPISTLRTSGSAVFVCSLTTMIGYGSLLVSENLAIRGFGAASLIGEVACVLTALVLVPALLVVGQRRKPPPLAIAREKQAA
ncbi:MAG: MMPL family transporter, partial [Deltaproteobacteria bacterium]